MKKTIFYLISVISFSNNLMAIGGDQEKRSIGYDDCTSSSSSSSFEGNSQSKNTKTLFTLGEGDEAEIRIYGETIKKFYSKEDVIVNVNDYLEKQEGYEIVRKLEGEENFKLLGVIYFYKKLENPIIFIHHYDGNIFFDNNNQNVSVQLMPVAIGRDWSDLSNVRLRYKRNKLRIIYNQKILTSNLDFNYDNGTENPVAAEGIENVMGYASDALMNRSIEALNAIATPIKESNFSDDYLNLTIQVVKDEIRRLDGISRDKFNRKTEKLWRNDLDNALRVLDGDVYDHALNNYPNLIDENLNIKNIFINIVLIIQHYKFKDGNIRDLLMEALIRALANCIELDGHRVCYIGKSKRLLNVLQGYIQNVGLDQEVQNVGFVAPPSEVWSHLNSEIDESAREDNLLSNVYFLWEFDDLVKAQFCNLHNAFIKKINKKIKDAAQRLYPNNPELKYKLRIKCAEKIIFFENEASKLFKMSVRDFEVLCYLFFKEYEEYEAIKVNAAYDVYQAFENFEARDASNILIDSFKGQLSQVQLNLFSSHIKTSFAWNCSPVDPHHKIAFLEGIKNLTDEQVVAIKDSFLCNVQAKNCGDVLNCFVGLNPEMIEAIVSSSLLSGCGGYALDWIKKLTEECKNITPLIIRIISGRNLFNNSKDTMEKIAILRCQIDELSDKNEAELYDIFLDEVRKNEEKHQSMVLLFRKCFLLN